MSLIAIVAELFYLLLPQYKQPIAFIAYGWERKSFYARKCHISMKNPSERERRYLEELKGPCLNSLSPQSELALDALKLVASYALNDIKYVHRLKRHYELFKEEIKRLHDIK